MNYLPIFAPMRRGFLIALLLIVTGVINAQDSLLKERILRQFHLSDDFSEETEGEVDTTFSLFHRFRVAEKYSIVNAGLGNYGLPFYQINFFDRITDPDKFLYSAYYPLMYTPERSVFMNTQVPFTALNWSFAGPRQTAEQTFRVMHTQNVNRFLNFGLIYDIVYALGQYNYQRADDKNFTLFSSYTGSKYKLYFSGGINNLTSFENGGITDYQQLEEQSNTRDVPVNLGGASNAISLLKHRSMLLVQRYTIGNTGGADAAGSDKEKSFPLSGTFSHIFVIEGNKRTYSDKLPQSGFYDFVYADSLNAVTFDSLSARFVKNTLRFDFATDESRKFRLGGGFGIRNELVRYSQIVPTFDTITLSDTAVWRRNNNAVIGKLYNNIGERFGWEATGELFLTGYRAGDFNLNANIRKSFSLGKGDADWIIRGSMSSTRPSFWMNQWGSNHFNWTNDLNKTFRINAGTDIESNFGSVRFDYAIIDNYVDFDTAAMPSQFSGGLSVAALAVRKELKAWKFHLISDLIFQQSSNNEILDLPSITIRSAGFFKHQWKFPNTGGALDTEIGADMTYHTKYFSYAYMPATGRFHRQFEEETGNYPFIDLFLNFKLRRTRFFLMLDHINAGLMGYRYSMTPHYPLNTRTFRYGLSWTFYD